MSTQHTPGPWTCHPRPNGNIDIKDDSSPLPWYIATAHDGIEDDANEPQTEANARLIAAAPDLLAALEWAMGGVPAPARRLAQNRQYCDGYDAARAAIAKATGGAE